MTEKELKQVQEDVKKAWDHIVSELKAGFHHDMQTLDNAADTIQAIGLIGHILSTTQFQGVGDAE